MVKSVSCYCVFGRRLLSHIMLCKTIIALSLQSLQIGGLCFSTVFIAVDWILTVNGGARGLNCIRRSVMSRRRVVRSPQDSKGMPRCCMCGDSGRCVRCACVQAGVVCSSCLLSRHGHCSNLSPQLIVLTLLRLVLVAGHPLVMIMVRAVILALTTLSLSLMRDFSMPLGLHCCIQRVIVMKILGVSCVCS